MKIFIKALPNILGKSLCGPDFLLDLEKYGYSIKTTQTYMENSTASPRNLQDRKITELPRPGNNNDNYNNF
jgi:hypothetical protein